MNEEYSHPEDDGHHGGHLPPGAIPFDGYPPTTATNSFVRLLPIRTHCEGCGEDHPTDIIAQMEFYLADGTYTQFHITLDIASVITAKLIEMWQFMAGVTDETAGTIANTPPDIEPGLWKIIEEETGEPE